MTLEHNTFITPGKIRMGRTPNAITTWKDNTIFSGGRDKNNIPQTYKIDTLMPYVPIPTHKTMPLEVMRSTKAPTLDGELPTDEWPGGYQRLDRAPSRFSYNGGPVVVKFFWDNKFLYIGAMMVMFDIANISMGEKWGKDDGVEISLAGFDKGKPTTFVIRSYVNGTIQSVTDAGASALAAERFSKGVRYVSKIMKEQTALTNRRNKGWIGEWAIPLDAIGLKPKPDLKVAFNMCAYINDKYDPWHCWEGTLGESWQVDQAGILLFK